MINLGRAAVHAHDTQCEVTGKKGKLSIGSNPNMDRLVLMDATGESFERELDELSSHFVADDLPFFVFFTFSLKQESVTKLAKPTVTDSKKLSSSNATTSSPTVWTTNL